MSGKLAYIIIVLSVFRIPDYAQESISADVTRGCDSLEVAFNVKNARELFEYSQGITWDFGDGESAEGTLTPTHFYTSPGLYFVTCDIGWAEIRYPDTIIISETPYPDFTYKISDDAVDLTYIFTPAYFTPIESVSLSYTWSFPDDSESNDSIATFTFDEKDIFDVQLSILDENGCVADTVKSVIIHDTLEIPNVFTPNGDGENDYFEVVVPEDYQYDFRIYTREGFLVFSSNSNKIFWDGYTFSNKEAAEGIYYYTLTSSDAPDILGFSNRGFRGYIYLFRTIDGK